MATLVPVRQLSRYKFCHGKPAGNRATACPGRFLQAHRARLSPAALGFAGGIRRRTPGLRREEIAQLAGLSTTWYTWIEQGREVSVSPAALARLAKTLQLSPAERIYLFDLAGKRDPAARPAETPSEAPAALGAAVGSIAVPAYVLDRGWNALAWNTPASRLFIGWLDQPKEKARDRNLLRFIFLEPAARRLIRGFEARARRVLAEFRAECGAFPEDPGMQSLAENCAPRAASSPASGRSTRARPGRGLAPIQPPAQGWLRL